MANIIFLSIFLSFSALPLLGTTQSGCSGPCETLDDCSGNLICDNGRCDDDPLVGNPICTEQSTCNPSGSYNCQGQSGPTYDCSSVVTSSTPALLTLNDFTQGGDGGDPSKCDEQFHDNTELVVALSTGWYDGGSRCGMMIRINANGNSVTAKVVDECDSMNGCDEEHAYQPPCRNNIVDGSAAVWNALGLDQDQGEVDCTWSME